MNNYRDIHATFRQEDKMRHTHYLIASFDTNTFGAYSGSCLALKV